MANGDDERQQFELGEDGELTALNEERDTTEGRSVPGQQFRLEEDGSITDLSEEEQDTVEAGRGAREQFVLGEDGEIRSADSEPVRQLRDGSEGVEQAKRAKEEFGDFFGQADVRDISRPLNFITSLGEGALDFTFEQLPKASAGIIEQLGGPNFRNRLRQAAKRSRREDISLDEAMKRMDEEQGLFENFFAGPAGTSPTQEQVEDNPLFRVGEQMGEFIDEALPQNPELKDEVLASQLPRAIGELGAFMAGGAAGGALRSAGFGRLTSVNLTASALGSANESVKSFKQARRQGASQDEAFTEFNSGIMRGALEGFPIAAGFKRLDRLSGGAVKETLDSRVFSTTASAIEEATQEGVSQVLRNASAQQTFDTTRELWENVGTNMVVGGAAGATMNSLAQGLQRKFQGAETTDEAAEVAEAMDFVRRKADGLEGFEGQTQDLFDTSVEGQFEPPSIDDVTPDQTTYAVDRETTTEKWRRGFLNWFSRRGEGKGVLPQSAMDLIIQKEGAIDREVKTMENNIRKIEDALKDEFDINEGIVGRLFKGPRSEEVPDEIYEQINFVLSGDHAPRPEAQSTESLIENTPGQIEEAQLPFNTRLETLPERLQQPVREAREHVDRLSKRFINEGIAQGELKMKIKKNIGSYLTRTYKRNDYEDWENYLFESEDGTRIINNAKSHIKAKAEDFGVDPENDDEVNRLVQEILDNGESEFDIFAPSGDRATDGIRWDVLQKKDQISEPLRALMGERTDGVVNYARSVQKMAALLESHRFQREFREVGLEEGWLKMPGFNPEFEDVVPEGSRMFNVLQEDGKPLQAERPVARAFKHGMDIQQAFGWFGEAFAKVNGFGKIAKTAFNVGTHLDNTIGAGIMFAQNGHLPTGQAMNEAKNAVIQNIAQSGQDDIDILQEATEFGIIGGGGISGEVRDLVNDIAGDEGRDIIDLLTTRGGRSRDHTFGLQSLARSGTERILDLYQASDDFFRVALWRKEARDYADILFDKKFENLNDDERSEVLEEAASIARTQFQDYSRVPKALKKARKLPFTNFLSFQYEAARTATNTAIRAKQEIQTGLANGNNKMYEKGMRRAAAAMTSYSGALFKGASKAGAMLAGISLTQDQEDAARKHMPPWDRNGILMPVAKEQRPARGPKYTFYNMSQHDPNTIINAIPRAIMRGAREDQVMDELFAAMRQQSQPALSPALVGQAVIDNLRNEKPSGAKVYHDGATFGEKAGAMMWRFYEQLEPGFQKAGREIGGKLGVDEAINQGLEKMGGDAVNIDLVDNRTDRANDPSDFILTALGLRATEVDPDRSLDFALNRLQSEIDKQEREFFSTRATEGQAETADELQESNRQFREEFKEVSEQIWSAYRLGMPLDRIEDKVKGMNFTNDQERQILTGVPGNIIEVEDLVPEEGSGSP